MPPFNEDIDNRRRAERLEFEADCGVEVVAPSWAMLADPLEGRTDNLTEHGIKIVLPEFPSHRFIRWEQHLQGGDYLGVNVILLREGRDPLSLPGHIVWISFRSYEDQSKSGDCDVGVLLQIMQPKTLRALRALIHGVN